MDKIDLHTHSISSFDSNIRLDLAIKVAKKICLKGIAVTDHNKFTKVKFIEKDFIVIDGMEISTDVGEILVYGIQETIKSHMPLDETIDKAHQQGAIAVAAHPFDSLRKGIGKGASKKFDGIEVFNSRNCFNVSNRKAELESIKAGLPPTGGSDAHTIQEIGSAFTLFSSVENQDDVLKAIKKGKCRPVGKTSWILVHAKSYAIRLEKIFGLI